MAVLEALITGLIALIIAPSQFFYFDVTPKVVALLLGTAILLIGAARKQQPGGPRWFTLLLCLNAASLAISTGLSTHRGLSLYGSTWRSYGALVEAVALLLAWMVASTCGGRPESARTVLRGIALASMVSGAYGIAQYFGWDPWIARGTYTIGEGAWSIVRPPGTLGNASYFATWLLMAIYLSLALVRMETSGWWRAMAYAAAAVALAAMVLTGTRAALVGLAAGGTVGLVWSGFRVPRRAAVAAALVLACGAAFSYSPPGLRMRSRSRWFAEDPWGGARLLLWRDSLAMSAHRPLAGFGPEVFPGEFPHYESKALAKAYPDFVHTSPDNILIDALVAQGIPGMLALGALCYAGFAVLWKQRTKFPAVAALLAAALGAGVVSQQFTAFTVPTAVLLLVVIAAAVGLTADTRPVRRAVLLPAVAPFVVVALVYFAARTAWADHALLETKRLIAAQDLRGATKQYESYWYWHLPGANADLWYSRAWMGIARETSNIEIMQQAVAIADQAAERSNTESEEPFAVWYDLAQIAAQRNDYDASDADLRRAIVERPNWFKPHWMLAQQLRMMSRLDEAEQEAALAVELDNGRDPEVAQTLRDIRARQADSHTP